MFVKDLTLWVLFDQYGDLLSPKKREVFEAYYGEDLSLAEIAEETGTTRQAVQDLIRRTGKELRGFEDHLHLVSRREAGTALCDRIEKSCDPAERKRLLQELKELF